MIILGLDPGLGTTGWGVIVADGNRLSHIANGQIKTDSKMALASRLLKLDLELTDLLLEHKPDGAAVEEVYVNSNPQSTLKLGQARGVVLLGASRTGIEVGEYSARTVKKSVVGGGNGDHARASSEEIAGQTTGCPELVEGPWSARIRISTSSARTDLSHEDTKSRRYKSTINLVPSCLRASPFL